MEINSEERLEDIEYRRSTRVVFIFFFLIGVIAVMSTSQDLMR